MQKIINELKITTGSILEFIVLKMLSGARTYSTEEMSAELKLIGFKTPMGSIYPLLTKFRRNKYVITGYEEGDRGAGIKTYKITEKGRQRLSDLRHDWKRLNQMIASIGVK